MYTYEVTLCKLVIVWYLFHNIGAVNIRGHGKGEGLGTVWILSFLCNLNSLALWYI